MAMAYIRNFLRLILRTFRGLPMTSFIPNSLQDNLHNDNNTQDDILLAKKQRQAAEPFWCVNR